MKTKSERWSFKRVREWYWKESWKLPGARQDNIKERRTTDPWIRPLIRFINRLPGCATICSCAGAGPRGVGKVQHPKGDTPYLFMVCRNPRVMAFLLAAYNKSGGLEIVISRKVFFSKLAGEETLTITFSCWKEMKCFERHLRKYIKQFRTKNEVEISDS